MIGRLVTNAENPYQPPSSGIDVSKLDDRTAKDHAYSRVGILVAVAPACLLLVLFYSLAIHMFYSLNGWPASIGTRGFSTLLSTHADVATEYFGILFLVSIVFWPPAILICALFRRCRCWLDYMVVYLAACIVCYVLMLLAPSPFLRWWWD